MNNNVLAAHLQNYIITLLGKETTQQTFLKVVKWNGSPPNAKMLKLPGGAFLLLQSDTIHTPYSTMKCESNRHTSIYYCIGHLPNNRQRQHSQDMQQQQRGDNPHPNPYWNLPKYTEYTLPGDVYNHDLGNMIVGATHQYTGERPSPKYIGFDITHIIDRHVTDIYWHIMHDETEKLFNWLRAIANGDVLQRPALMLADYTHFVRNHYKSIVATLGMTRSSTRSYTRALQNGRMAWSELHTLFGPNGVFAGDTFRDSLDLPYDNDEIAFSDAYNSIIDQFVLKN